MSSKDSDMNWEDRCQTNVNEIIILYPQGKEYQNLYQRSFRKNIIAYTSGTQYNPNLLI